MELTLTYPKAPLNHIITLPTKQIVPLNNNFPFPSNSPIQIQLPLLKPQPKPNQPVKKTSPISNPVHKTIVKEEIITTCSDILDLMDSLKLVIPLDLYISLVKECTETRDTFQAIKLHNHIIQNRRCPSLPLLNRLLLMNVFCDCFDQARYVFDNMRVRNINAWAVMIAGYVENGKYDEAMHLFIEMQRDYKSTNEVNNKAVDFMISGIVISVLKACIETMRFELGEQLHGWIIKLGYSKNLVLSSFLISFYGKFGFFKGGDLVFNHVSCQNTVVWTAKIVNYCNEEKFNSAVHVFKDMGKEGVKKNSFTYSSVLKACGKVNDNGFCGRQVHGNAIKSRLDMYGYVQCGLIDMYRKHGLVNEAKLMFDMIGEKRNEACWNALLTCYLQHGYCIEAIKLLYEMKAAGLKPPGSLLNESRLVCGSN